MLKLKKPTTLVLGTARSGTTWLSQILSRSSRYRFLFEPFHTEYFEEAKLVADRYFLNMPPTHVQKYIHRHISDKVNNKWVLQNVSKNIFIRRNPFWAKHIICKDIRTILLIPTYLKLYGDQIKIICITRSPYYVINSMARAKFPWTFDIDSLLQQVLLEKEYNIPISKLNKYSNSNIERLTIRWIIENLFLLKMPQEFPVYLTYYEKLVQNPMKELENICDFANISLDKDISQELKKPSYTTSKNSPFFSNMAQNNQPDDKYLIDKIFGDINFEYPFT